jgi:hypothetical protein
MTRYIKLFLFVLLNHAISAQNIFDEAHSRKYADFLFSTHQFSLAAEENERLLFFRPANDTLKLNLLKSYRNIPDFGSCQKAWSRLFSNFDSLTYPFNEEYAKMLILTKNFPKAELFLQQNVFLSLSDKQRFAVDLSVFAMDTKSALTLISQTSYPLAQVHSLLEERQKLGRKSPAKAAIFSALLPGTGKIYTKDWKDGILSFVIIAGNAWQSYRGFNKYGKNSAYGWIFGGLAVGFYSGNIYGAVQSAKDFNKRTDEKYYTKAASIISASY